MTASGPHLVEQRAHGVAVGDVAAHEAIARVAGDARKRSEIGGVGELVEIDDGPVGGADQVPADGRADEAGPSGYDHFHASVPRAALASAIKRKLRLQPTAPVNRVLQGQKLAVSLIFAHRAISAPPPRNVAREPKLWDEAHGRP